MRFRSRSRRRRAGRVAQPALGPDGGWSPSYPAFCDTLPRPDECIVPGRRPWMGCHSTLQFAQRRAVDIHGVAVMPHATEQRVYHRFVAEEVMPLVIDQIGCNDRGMAVVPLLHQFEEDVALLGLQGQISKFVNQKY